MKASSIFAVLVSLLPVVHASMPSKVYGVNLGSWYVVLTLVSFGRSMLLDVGL